MPEVVGNDRNCLTLSSCQIEEDHGRPTWFFGGWRWGILRNFNYSKLPGFQALNWWCVVLEKSNPHFQVLKVNVPDYLILGCFKNSFPKHAKLHAEELGTWKTAVYLGCWEIYNMGRGGVPDAITWRTFHFAFTKVGRGDRGLRILASWRWYEGTPAQKNHWMQWCRGPPFLRCKHKGAPMFFFKKNCQPTNPENKQPTNRTNRSDPTSNNRWTVRFTSKLQWRPASPWWNVHKSSHPASLSRTPGWKYRSHDLRPGSKGSKMMLQNEAEIRYWWLVSLYLKISLVRCVLLFGPQRFFLWTKIAQDFGDFMT